MKKFEMWVGINKMRGLEHKVSKYYYKKWCQLTFLIKGCHKLSICKHNICKYLHNNSKVRDMPVFWIQALEMSFCIGLSM